MGNVFAGTLLSMWRRLPNALGLVCTEGFAEPANHLCYMSAADKCLKDRVFQPLQPSVTCLFSSQTLDGHAEQIVV